MVKNMWKCIKVLEFPYWHCFMKEDNEIISIYDDIHDILGKDVEEYHVTFNRPGWYYDRRTKKCWIEFPKEFPGHTSYEVDTNAFFLTLKVTESTNNLLVESEVQAMKHIIQYTKDGKLRKELQNRLYDDSFAKELQLIERRSFLFRLKAEEE